MIRLPLKVLASVETVHPANAPISIAPREGGGGGGVYEGGA